MSSGLVFVVDDNPSICALVQTVLEDEGYIVRTFLNGREVLEALESTRPNTVLFDLWMDQLTGQDLYVRMHELNPQPKYVLMSAATHASSVAEELGIEVLRKPFDIEELLEMTARDSSTEAQVSERP